MIQNGKHRHSNFVTAMTGNSPPQDRKNAIAVIDFEVHTRGGHFGDWLVFFANEFAKRFDHVLVYTPDPVKTAGLFESAPEARRANITLAKLPQGKRRRLFSSRRKKCSLGEVFREAEKLAPSSRVCGFVTWGYDLEAPETLVNLTAHPWATLVNPTWHERGFKNAAAQRDAELLKLLNSISQCVRMLWWDHFAISRKHSNVLWIPGRTQLQLASTQPPLVERIRAHAGDRFLIGSPGILTGPRGVNEMVRLAGRHPDIRFVLAGKLVRESVDPDLLSKLDAARPANLMLAEGYLDEPQLNAVVKAADAFFIDGAAHPQHTSIAIKALFFGKCLLTTESNSWMRDVIQKWDAGVVYTNRDMDLTAAWQQWRSSGGPDNALRAAEALASERDIAACFDELTRVLTEAR
jgi:hypothetical protein